MKNIVLSLLFIIVFPLIGICQNKFSPIYLTADSLYKARQDGLAYTLLRPLFETEKNDSLQIEIAIRLGYISSDANKIDSAIFFLKKAISVCKNKNIHTRLGRTYNGIGNQYLLKKNYKEAMPYFEEALTASLKETDSVKVYVSMLVLYLKQKFYKEAYSLVKEKLAKYNINTVPYQDFYVYETLGNYYLSKNIADSALNYFLLASKTKAEDRLRANAFNDVAETYIALKQFKTAFAYQDSAAAINATINAAENLLPFYETYSKLYEETGEYKKALFYSKLRRNLSDSFFDVEKNNATLDLEAKYQNEKTKAEKLIVEKDNSIKERNLVFSFIALGLVALLAFVGLRSAGVRKKANNILAAQKLEVQQLANELAVANDTKARLFSTIGHDLRSPISSLYSQLKLLELKGNTANTAMSQQTTNLLDTLEELLVWSKSQMEGFVLQKVKINMHVLFEELKDFYGATAEAKNIFIVNEASENLIARTDENILKTILRNLISNAIAHTTAEKNIILHASKENDTVFIAIKNACSKEAYEKLQSTFANANIKSNAHGFGIVLVKEFAQKINTTVHINYDGQNAIIGFTIV
jgi:signal transduction histidine kinase